MRESLAIKSFLHETQGHVIFHLVNNLTVVYVAMLFVTQTDTVLDKEIEESKVIPLRK